MNDYIYFHIPGISDLFELNYMLLSRMYHHPDHFRDNVRIGSIYGAFPGTKWNGGRLVAGSLELDKIQEIADIFYNIGIPLKFTYTNPTLTQEDLEDELSNKIAAMCEDSVNEVLVSTDLMKDYIKNKYPEYRLASSTTKRLTSIDDINAELDNPDYDLVVLDYDLNNDFEKLALINKPEKCELLLNAVCNPNCPNRKRHYEIIGNLQRGVDDHDEVIDKCPSQGRLFYEIKKLDNFISVDDLYNIYVPKGFKHFKIEGRGIGPLKPLEWYLYYLVKPEYQEEERCWLNLSVENMMVHPMYPTLFD